MNDFVIVVQPLSLSLKNHVEIANHCNKLMSDYSINKYGIETYLVEREWLKSVVNDAGIISAESDIIADMDEVFVDYTFSEEDDVYDIWDPPININTKPDNVIEYNNIIYEY